MVYIAAVLNHLVVVHPLAVGGIFVDDDGEARNVACGVGHLDGVGLFLTFVRGQVGCVFG